MWNWQNSLPWAWNSTRRSQSDLGVGRAVRTGTPGIFYDENGRLFYQKESLDTRTATSSLPRVKYGQSQLRQDDAFTYDPRKTHSDSRGPRSWDFLREETPRSSGRGHAIITKHYDNYKQSPHMGSRLPHRGEIVTVGAPLPNETFYPSDRKQYVREGSVIVEERIVSHERPWIWPLYLIAGFIMFAAGIVNLLFCVDNHYYAYFWVPVFLVVFAIVGALHKGVYRGSKGRRRNWAYIIVGVITTVCIVICCALVQIRLNHVTIQISEHGAQGFIDYETHRMVYHSEIPRVNLTQSLDSNIWACYSIDWVGLILTLVAFTVLSSVVVIGNNFYNSNHDYGREVDPFCRPSLFNPWGQITASQVMIFFGTVVKTSTHGNLQVRWQDYWLPVWGAAFPMIAGALSAVALKRVGLRHGRGLTVAAAILQIVSFIVVLICVVIITLALYENIQSLTPGPISTAAYSQRLLTSSVVLMTVLDIVLLVVLVYALALLIRVIVEGCCKNKDPRRREKRYYAEERYDEDRFEERYPEKISRDYPAGVYREDVVERF